MAEITNLLLLSRHAVSITRKLMAVNSLVEEPCLYGRGRGPFRDLSSLGGFPSIIRCRSRRYFSAPSTKKRLLPLHLVLPRGSAVVFGSGRSMMLSHCFVAVNLDLAG